jgi:hypothetical protein
MATNVTFTFDLETVDRLERLAAYAEMNRSEYLRFLIAREFRTTDFIIVSAEIHLESEKE